jgi:hypothetical protein
MEPRFFAFNPRSVRRALALGACLLAILSAWALAEARATRAVLSAARAGLTGGLLFTFAFSWHRLRPRPGWGITLSPRGVELSRPLTGSSYQLPWGRISSVRRLGRQGDMLGLFLEEGGQVIVTRHLFPSRTAFGELAAALEERKPPQRFDA